MPSLEEREYGPYRGEVGNMQPWSRPPERSDHRDAVHRLRERLEALKTQAKTPAVDEEALKEQLRERAVELGMLPDDRPPIYYDDLAHR